MSYCYCNTSYDDKGSIIVECSKTKTRASSYGLHERGLKRALCLLTNKCDCGATWHYVHKNKWPDFEPDDGIKGNLYSKEEALEGSDSESESD